MAAAAYEVDPILHQSVRYGGKMDRSTAANMHEAIVAPSAHFYRQPEEN